ncbi:MAG: hypothetical protein HEQ19_31215 [Gloeotrichia echinulata CP02]
MVSRWSIEQYWLSLSFVIGHLSLVICHWSLVIGKHLGHIYVS